jgi:solute carrier family 50 protein (sugar transporter)
MRTENDYVFIDLLSVFMFPISLKDERQPTMNLPLLLLLACTIARITAFSCCPLKTSRAHAVVQRNKHVEDLYRTSWQSSSPATPTNPRWNGQAGLPGSSSRSSSSTQLAALSPNLISVAQSIAPRVGIVTSTVLYFSPMVSVYRAVFKEKKIGNLNPLPLTFMAITSVAWLAYGLVAQDPFVALSNILGSIASIGYVVGLLPLMQGNDGSNSTLRRNQGVLLGGASLSLCLWTYLALSKMELWKMAKALGLFASSLFLMFSASPLSSIGSVVSNRDASSILAPLTIAQVVNTGLWSAYGLAIGDVFVWSPNMAGLGLGLMQLLLKIVFPGKKASK